MMKNYDMGVFERLLIKWQTRSLGVRVERMMTLLPVFVCIGGNENFEKVVSNTRKVIFRHIKSKRLAMMIFKRVMYKAKQYSENSELLSEKKQKIYEMITQNIQMFSLVLDVLDGIDRELQRSTMIVKRNYEEEYSLPIETKRLLNYQERRLFIDQNTIE